MVWSTVIVSSIRSPCCREVQGYLVPGLLGQRRPDGGDNDIPQKETSPGNVEQFVPLVGQELELVSNVQQDDGDADDLAQQPFTTGMHHVLLGSVARHAWVISCLVRTELRELAFTVLCKYVGLQAWMRVSNGPFRGRSLPALVQQGARSSRRPVRQPCRATVPLPRLVSAESPWDMPNRTCAARCCWIRRRRW